MKRIILSIFVIFLFSVILPSKEVKLNCKNTNNPLLKQFKTPFGVPPFDKIKEEHYLPAIKCAILEHKGEIEKIINNPEKPTFKNTIEALDFSGRKLRLITNIFFNQLSADTNDKLQKIAKEVSPLLSKHTDEILMNDKLFKRVESVYKKRDKLNLNSEQKRVLTLYYKDFVRGGAKLCPAKKKRLAEINSKLSLLTLKFGENVLKDTKAFELVIDNKADLAGLPEGLIKAAEEAARAKGYKGKWLFTLDKPMLIPFLEFSDKRELRKKMLLGYIMKGDNNNENDNKKIISEIVNLRIEKAHLLGYRTHANYILEENMAKNPQNVYELLWKIWMPALRKAKEERKLLQEMIYKDGKKFKLKPWDWWYYAEKVKKAKYNLDTSKLKPYFKLENVLKDGVFNLVHRLYGLTFEERHDLPKYNKDVKTFLVKDSDGSLIGIIYLDYYPRPGKRGGAWMSPYRKEAKVNGKRVVPIIVNVGNFTKPTADKPSLLSLEEVLTMFHEFGHALHGLLSQCTYYRVSGTDVARDFVELPSQIMENWALEPELLKMYAKHYKTGKTIPMDMIEKIKNSSKFNQGFATTEYLAASFLDMDWHTLEMSNDWDVTAFETNSMARIGLIPEIYVRYRSTYFQHIFAGGYSAGYYSYIWAEVLDSDAFHAYKEKGNLFDKEIATRFRKYILEKGGSEDPMELYIKFRGRKPDINALLEKRGLKE